MATWVLRLLAVVWTSGLLVVVVGAYAPRLPVIGFLGSFVTGQYPVHATLGAVIGVGVGAGAWALGARPTGVVATLLALGCAAALVGVLAAQAATARAEGVRIDWGAALTTPRQPAGHPDRTAEFAVDGEGRTLRLDLYRPVGPGPHPVVVWVHGGSWVRGERDDRTALDRWLADRGYAVVAYYPVTDLRLVDPSLQDAVLGGRADAFPDATRTASPIDLVRPDLPPTLLVMGSADHFVFPERVIAYDAALRAAGVPGRLLVVPYADHVFDFPFGSPGAQLTRPAVAAFLAEHVPATAG